MGGRQGGGLSAGRKATLIGGFVKEKLLEQVRAVAFVTLWLAGFQTLVLRVPIARFWEVSGGILLVVAGLALFMEGLFLAVMPLAERCGLRLPRVRSLKTVLTFAAVLGVVATCAEPSIGVLKQQGSAVEPWREPLLYYLLNGGAGWLIGAIAAGVGVSVVVGVLRFVRGWALKPMLYPLIPVLLAVTAWAVLDARTAGIVGLAWDSGGVTTGPVTVPLVIALGVGVSRIAGRKEDAGGGLGVVTFASALPVLAVFGVALWLAPSFPEPGTAEAFFAPENREAALRVASGDEAALRALGSAALDDEAWAACFDGERPAAADAAGGGALLKAAAGDAAKAILPLVALLLASLLFVVRERIPHGREVALGVAFALGGLTLFNAGMTSGLHALGTQAGSSLSRAWEATERPDKAVVFEGVEEGMLVRAVRAEGGEERYLAVSRDAAGGGAQLVPFREERFDRAAGRYEWVPTDAPVAGGGRGWGYALALFFAFALGVGATMAEPALNALGVTLEEMTAGTYRRSFLIACVALGVGAGMVLGFGRILFGLNLAWLLGGGYAVALALTWFSGEDIAAIAWDSAGVTTGPITVPLVIATGLGIGSVSGVPEAFGVVAMASVCPIVSVLAAGLWVAARRRAVGGGAIRRPERPETAEEAEA